MSDGFQRRRGGGVVATFSGFEADLLRSLASQLVELLRNEAAAEFRRFTESTLRDNKAKGAAAVIEALEEAGLPPELTEDGLVIEVELDQAGALAWLKSFTDVRLALATRLSIEEDDEDYWLALPDDDPRAHVYDIYQWVGYLQETLVAAVSRSR
jgi:hypothetical protein